MTTRAWYKSLDPKVRGALNLHHALEKRDDQLEFFLLLSSMTGSLGTATEANYCSANAFLDAFAGHRRSMGLKATAVGLGIISEVGYLHEHPEIEKLLLRKGIQPINEQELLQICDIALSEKGKESHFLTGLETEGMMNLRRQGFEALSHVLDDPRADIIGNALYEEYESVMTHDVQQKIATKESLLELSVQSYLKPNGTLCERPNDGALLKAIQSIVATKFCDLLLLSPEQLSVHTPLGTFGMDSMLASESRHFFFHTFAVDVPFLMLLAAATTVESLSETIALRMWTLENEKKDVTK
jgi:hypothetical protein